MDLQEFSLISCSCWTGNDLYSATSINFLGSEPVVLRSSDLALRTEFKSSWLNGELKLLFTFLQRPCAVLSDWLRFVVTFVDILNPGIRCFCAFSVKPRMCV